MPKEKEEVKKTEAPAPKVAKFIVLDANGKEFRSFDKEAEAVEFAEHVRGRLKK